MLLKRLKRETIAGLSIHDTAVSVSIVSRTRRGAVRLDACGYLEKEATLGEKETALLIRKLWKKYSISTRTVSSSFHGASLLVKYFKYDAVAENELRPVLEIDAESTFQKPKEKLLIDYFLYPKKGEGENVAQEGILCAIPKKIVRTHLRILQHAGLYPVVLDIDSFAIANCFCALKDAWGAGSMCVVYVDQFSMSAAIISRNGMMYPRHFHSGESWERRIPFLIENLSDLIKFYEFKLRGESVRKLCFVGTLVHNQELQDAIREAIEELPIEFWNPLDDIAHKARFNEEEQAKVGPLLATTIGTALRKDV